MAIYKPQKNEIKPCDQCGSARHSIFCKLNTTELADLSKEKTHLFFQKGHTIFSEQSHPLGLYCIYEGRIKIHKCGPEGKEHMLRFAKKGDVIGYRSLISEEPYQASATAIEDSVVCFFSKKTYQQQIIQNHSVTLQLMKTLSENLKQSEVKTLALTQKNATARIVETIMIMKDFFGVLDDQTTINVTLTRENIASLSGTTTETCIRVLSKLQKQKMIALVGKKIKIVDPSALVKITEIRD